MRSITVVLLGLLVAFTSGFYVSKDVKYADPELVNKQSIVFELLQHVHLDDIFSKDYSEYKHYPIHEHLDEYLKPEVVKHFLDLHHHHPISHDEIFSIFDEEHEEHAQGLAAVFYYAKDFEVFKKSILWAKFNVNPQLFVYAVSVAVLHRRDLVGVSLPAIYEIYPHYFFSGDIIQKAQYYKMRGFKGVKEVEGVSHVVVPANYSDHYGHINEESVLAYFVEDVGLNAFYFYYNLYYPYWASDEQFGLKKDHPGALYFYVHWQLLARYYLERLSHNLDEIDEFSWYGHIKSGYHSHLRYYNGICFPDRDNNYEVYQPHSYHLIDLVDNYNSRILDSIDSQRFLKEDGKYWDFHDHKVEEIVNHLGNIVQGNKFSLNEKYYGHLDRQVRNVINKGVSHQSHHDVLPGVLTHYASSMRDPAFYHMYKRILQNYWYYKDQVPPYSHSELAFDGVKIENVEVDKLVSYYDKFDADISNAVDVEPFDESVASDLAKFGRVSHHHGKDFVIKARQSRLNHLPFNVKISVKSDKLQKAVVKLFLGPKYDVYGHKIDFHENRKNFFELDHFLATLNPGVNSISRSSNEFVWFVKDRSQYYELYKRLFQSQKPDHKFLIDMSEANCGFPDRLMLPRGKKGGMPYQIFVFIYPYVEPKVKQFSGFDPASSCGVGSGSRYLDDSPFGYPLDRSINIKDWHQPNMYFHDVLIYYKSESEVNVA